MSADTKILEGYLAEQELAKQLAVSERTLERWRTLREGPPVTRIGRKPYYKAESVIAWIKSREKRMSGGRAA